MTVYNSKQDELAPPIALIGAYERDNFGDVLFLQVTRELLGKQRIIASAPFEPADGFSPAGEHVTSYNHATALRPRAVWMVGGEAGGTSMTDAFRMAAGEAALARHSSESRRGQAESLRELTGRSTYSSPYIPRMSASVSTLRTPFVVNSAGLSGLRGLVGHRRDEAWTAVSEAQFISVRDAQSSKVLKAEGIDHLLAPDLIQSLRTLRSSWTERRSPSHPYALVHVKGTSLRDYGAAKLAETLLAAAPLKQLRIYLFVAGSARGHDSLDEYAAVIAAARALDPSRPLELLDVQDPMEKARAIAQASLWIGTSLHGLIISSAFDVPRVGLELDKLVRYAETWQDPMPVGVPLSDIAQSSADALGVREAAGRAEGMSAAAIESARCAMRAIDEATPADLNDVRQRNARTASRRSRSPLRGLTTIAAERVRAWRRR